MIEIRSARIDDCSKLMPLLDELGYPTLETDLAVRLETILSRDDFAIFIAEIGNEVTGLICLTLMPSLYRAGLQGAITTLVVSHNFRGQGIARQLIECGERWLHSHGAVNPSNHRQVAHQLYEAAGFSGTGVRFTKSLTAAQ